MPNTRVDLRSALLGGIAAGTLWQLNNQLNVIYVSKVVSANKLYGSLGLIPVFLFGLYISWLILLLGAQVAYTFQNAHVLARNTSEEDESPNQLSKEKVALRVMLLIARRFVRAEPALSASELSDQTGAPLNLVNQIIQPLCAARLVVETGGEGVTFLPARPLDQVTAYDILRALRELDGKAQETTRDDDEQRVRAMTEKISAGEEDVARKFDFGKLAVEKESSS
jgi:membrane protein